MPIADKTNLYLDRPSASRGYMSGEDVTWTGQPTSEHIYNWLRDMGLVQETSENLLREAVRQIIRGSLPASRRLEECIVVGGQASGENVLVKSRDRIYNANVKLVRELLDDGTEIVYMLDMDSGYVEGMNSHGIGIINAALEPDHSTADAPEPSNSGPRIKRCLQNDNLQSAIDDLLSLRGGVEGHTIVGSPKAMYAIEHPGTERYEGASGKETVIELPMDGTFDVFTNHGENIPDAGFEPSDGKRYHSSLSRQKQAQHALVDTEDFSKIPVLIAKQNFDPESRFNMRRNIEGGMHTVSQVAMHLPDLEFVFYYFPHVCTLHGIENRTPSGYEPKINIRIIRYKNYDKS